MCRQRQQYLQWTAAETIDISIHSTDVTHKQIQPSPRWSLVISVTIDLKITEGSCRRFFFFHCSYLFLDASVVKNQHCYRESAKIIDLIKRLVYKYQPANAEVKTHQQGDSENFGSPLYSHLTQVQQQRKSGYCIIAETIEYLLIKNPKALLGNTVLRSRSQGNSPRCSLGRKLERFLKQTVGLNIFTHYFTRLYFIVFVSRIQHRAPFVPPPLSPVFNVLICCRHFLQPHKIVSFNT